MKVHRSVREFFARQRIAGPGVIAVSGGADSVALLLAIHPFYHESLTIAHANHQLRGPESDEDAGFVAELAKKLQIPVQIGRISLPNAINLESNARTLRYQWLANVAAERSATWIATGHTADDQAETILHRLVRGTGLQGLRGIRPIRKLDESTSQCQLIRPMLEVSRTEILADLSARNQPFRTDSTNVDDRFTRNRIRHHLLPLMKEFNPEVVSLLGRLAHQADDTFDFVEAEATRLLLQAERPRAGTKLILDKSAIEGAPFVVKCELFRLVWVREGWPLNDMTFDHWRRIATPTPGDYPGGVTVRLVAGMVQIEANPSRTGKTGKNS